MGASGLHQIFAAGMLHLQAAPGNSNKGTLGFYWENGKENGNYGDYRVGCILGLYWENRNMETTGIIGAGCILGLHWDNGKENGNYKDYRGSIWGYVLIC